MDLSTTIRILYNVQNLLEELNENDNEIQQIYELVVKYMDKCKHNIITDYIDISPDNGHTIKYCDICMKTFQTVKDCK
jgi:hypothetical protein